MTESEGRLHLRQMTPLCLEKASMEIEDVITSRHVQLQVTEQEDRSGILAEDRIRVGQALAQIELEEIIGKTKRWAGAGKLNRGLRLTLPFFDDRLMEIRWIDLEVIPRGRIPFLPAFVVLAARREAERTSREEDLTPTTREHLLGLLRMLEVAFGGNQRA